MDTKIVLMERSQAEKPTLQIIYFKDTLGFSRQRKYTVEK